MASSTTSTTHKPLGPSESPQNQFVELGLSRVLATGAVSSNDLRPALAAPKRGAGVLSSSGEFVPENENRALGKHEADSASRPRSREEKKAEWMLKQKAAKTGKKKAHGTSGGVNRQNQRAGQIESSLRNAEAEVRGAQDAAKEIFQNAQQDAIPTSTDQPTKSELPEPHSSSHAAAVHANHEARHLDFRASIGDCPTTWRERRMLCISLPLFLLLWILRPRSVLRSSYFGFTLMYCVFVTASTIYNVGIQSDGVIKMFLLVAALWTALTCYAVYVLLSQSRNPFNDPKIRSPGSWLNRSTVWYLSLVGYRKEVRCKSRWTWFDIGRAVDGKSPAWETDLHAGHDLRPDTAKGLDLVHSEKPFTYTMTYSIQCPSWLFGIEDLDTDRKWDRHWLAERDLDASWEAFCQLRTYKNIPHFSVRDRTNERIIEEARALSRVDQDKYSNGERLRHSAELAMWWAIAVQERSSGQDFRTAPVHVM